MDALNANGKTQLFTNLVWRSNARTAVRKTSSERERERKEKKDNKTNNNNNNSNKKQQQKWGTGTVQDKPFDELLMFIVDKDSALFSGL